ncbi:SDR family NAD(P)-dependent oxidoreductase [Bradyrhizobium sp.]|uniref:SDR family NAD(P)-dependent oxidoreductase n=1 Tax=Bradyrhizobium sp. TaxID=376 RepID=UPI0040380E45
MTDRVTLVTGASAGIGKELARIFAAKGHRVALTARRAERLDQLASEIVAAGGKQPLVIPCDLQRADACDTIERALAAAGAELEYLVNNAGFGVFGHAIKRDRNDQLGIIAVNVCALTDLTLRFADQLIRNRGGILNIGSIAGFLPGPGMAVYYATKAYVLSFTEAMRHELAPLGVRVTVVCPGPVLTEFQARAGFAPGYDSAILNVSAAEVARQGYEGLMANKRAVLPGFGIKMVPFLLRLFPRSFILAAVGGFQLRNR